MVDKGVVNRLLTAIDGKSSLERMLGRDGTSEGARKAALTRANGPKASPESHPFHQTLVSAGYKHNGSTKNSHFYSPPTHLGEGMILSSKGKQHEWGVTSNFSKRGNNVESLAKHLGSNKAHDGTSAGAKKAWESRAQGHESAAQAHKEAAAAHGSPDYEAKRGAAHAASAAAHAASMAHGDRDEKVWSANAMGHSAKGNHGSAAAVHRETAGQVKYMNEPIEAKGQSESGKHWQKIFKSAHHLNQWHEKNGGSVHGTRSVDDERSRIIS